MTAKENYEQMEQVQERLLELLHYQKNRLAYRKRTEIAVDIVRQKDRRKVNFLMQTMPLIKECCLVL